MESPGAAPKAPAAAHGAERPLSCSPLGSGIAYQPHEDDPSAHEAREESEKWGDITVAAPKIWQYERVNTYLDGLLRDVEAVSLADLTQLDPNAQNAGAIKFIQSALEIGVQYNQAVGANNALALEAWKAQTQLQLQQIQTNSANLQALQASRTSVIQQLAQAQASLNNLQAIPAGGTALTQGQSAQVSALQTQISNLNSELASLNTAIQSASAMPTLPPPPTLAVPTISGPASGTNVSSTFSGLGEYLSKLPSGIQSELTAALQAPSYPATKRMDSFMTLLYERMAREISALQDDLMRDPNTVAYLVQFDVGLHPASRTKNHIARVEFRLDDSSCPGCKVYSIYPGQSSYNVANYKASSYRRSFWGNFLFLIGLGVSAAYTRQEDTLHGSLVQSVYTSGFQDQGEDARTPDQNGLTQRFGWEYGPAPFETYVSPGIRTTFAIITVPRNTISKSQRTDAQNDSKQGDGTQDRPLPQLSCFELPIRAYWGLRDNPYYQKAHFIVPADHVGERDASVRVRDLKLYLPGSPGIEALPGAVISEPNRLHVTGMEYNPVYPSASAASSPPAASGGTSPAAAPAVPAASSPAPYSTTPCPARQCAAVVLALDQPIDPNLVVTVNGTVLTRVRDWRGRATSLLPPAQSGSDQTAAALGAAGTAPAAGAAMQGQPERLFRTTPGLLEADLLGPNTWYALDSHRLLLTVARQTVPDEEFPIIRLADPSRKVLTLPLELDQAISDIVVNGFHLPARTQEQLRRRINIRYKGSPSQTGSESTDMDSAGPYPTSTFLPLFLESPEPQDLYAYLGETGRQILIGFRNDSLSPSYKEAPRSHRWLASRDQVILEDRKLDLAWSLDCLPQGNQLVCDIPQKQIASAYTAVDEACRNVNCAARSSIADLPFVTTLQLWVEQYDPDSDDAFYSSSPIPLGLFPVQTSKCEGSREPQCTAPLVDFVRWHFDSSSMESVKVKGCHYAPYLDKAVNVGGTDQDANALRILGLDPDSPDAYQKLEPAPFAWKEEKRIEAECSTFGVPTIALGTSDVVLMPAYADSTTKVISRTKTALSISSFGLRPYFGLPTITPKWSGPGSGSEKQPSRVAYWKLEFPAGRLDWDDKFDVSADVLKALHVVCPAQSAQGNPNINCALNSGGATAAPPRGAVACEAIGKEAARNADRPDKWDLISRQGWLRVEMCINRDDLMKVPREVPLVRHGTTLARLHISRMLLPSKLKLETVSPTQFALKGRNAYVIDAVALQDGKNVYRIPTAVGTDFALVSLPLKSPTAKQQKAADCTKAGTAPCISGIDPSTAAAGASVTISGQGFGTTKGSVSFGGTKATKITGWTPTAIQAEVPAGAKSGSVVVTIPGKSSKQVAFKVSEPPAPAKCDAAVKDTPCIIKVEWKAANSTLTISGQGFGTNKGSVSIGVKSPTATVEAPWNQTAVTVKLSAAPDAPLSIVVMTAGTASAGFPFTVSTAAPATSAGAGDSSDSSDGETPATTIPPGTYAVLALFQTGGSGPTAEYVPLDVTDSQGKQLTFTVPKAPAKTGGDGSTSATTTITVTNKPGTPASGKTDSGTTP